jgi:hypothetical protein
MKKIRSFVLILAAAAAIFLGAKTPEQESVIAAGMCNEWRQQCGWNQYPCYQNPDGTVRQCWAWTCYWYQVTVPCCGAIFCTGPTIVAL